MRGGAGEVREQQKEPEKFWRLHKDQHQKARTHCRIIPVHFTRVDASVTAVKLGTLRQRGERVLLASHKASPVDNTMFILDALAFI